MASDGHDAGGTISLFSGMRQPGAATAKIESYWDEVRAGRLVPSRCEIDPQGMEGVLGHAFVLERIAGGLARFRIAGSHLAELTGLELRQMPISALFLPESRETLAEALAAVFDEPAAIRMQIGSSAGFGRHRLDGHMVLLPLRSDFGDIDRVLGGIVLSGKIGRTPRRLEIHAQSRKSLTGYAGPRHGRDSEVANAQTTAPRRAGAGSKHVPGHPSERAYLRLVVVNE